MTLSLSFSRFSELWWRGMSVGNLIYEGGGGRGGGTRSRVCRKKETKTTIVVRVKFMRAVSDYAPIGPFSMMTMMMPRRNCTCSHSQLLERPISKMRTKIEECNSAYVKSTEILREISMFNDDKIQPFMRTEQKWRGLVQT